MPDKIDFKATIVLKETKKFYNNNKKVNPLKKT